METCKYCKKSFKKEELNIHEFNCASSYGNENILENMIPCEICRELIEFDKYNEHISLCSITTPPRFFIQPYSLNTESIENFLNSISETLNIQPNNLESNNLDSNNNNPETLPNNLESNNLPNNNEEEISEVNININSNIQQIRNNISLINNILNTRNYSSSNQTTNDYESLSELDNDNVKIGIDINKISSEIVISKQETCSICFEDFKINNKMRKLNCNHILCNECSVEWFSENLKCPICMEELG